MVKDTDLIKNIEEYLIKDNGSIFESNWDRMIQKSGVTLYIKNDIELKRYIYNLYDSMGISKLFFCKIKFYDFVIDKYIELLIKKDVEVDIRSEIQEMELTEFRVLLPIFNIQIKTKKIELVGNTVVQFQSIDKYCEENQFVIPDYLKESYTEKYFAFVPFLEIVVKARDMEFAEIFAKEKLAEFIHILNFMLFYCYRGIETISSVTKGGTLERSFIFTKQNCTFKSKKNHPHIKRITFENCQEYLSDDKNGNKQIFDIFNKSNRNEMEKRIFNAVNWIGMAVAERNNSMAFSMASYAIESLLQYQQKGEIINKSIVASMSEAIAFILGSNFDERKNYEKKFQDLYKIRSKIVHGKNSDITDYQTLEMIDLGVQLVRKLLTDEKFGKDLSSENIKDYIYRQRYTTLGDKE